jgi:hypothetical protein
MAVVTSLETTWHYDFSGGTRSIPPPRFFEGAPYRAPAAAILESLFNAIVLLVGRLLTISDCRSAIK